MYIVIQIFCIDFTPTGQWRPTPTPPAPTTPPPRPPAPSTPLTTTPGTTSAPRPRLSHWTEASGQPTSPQEPVGPQGDTRPLWAGPHQDTGSRVEEIQRLTGRGSSRLRNTGLGTGRFPLWCCLITVFSIISTIFALILLNVSSQFSMLLCRLR